MKPRLYYRSEDSYGMLTLGTQVPLYQDHERSDSHSSYLMAIKEEGSSYGVAFVDTSLGTFHVS